MSRTLGGPLTAHLATRAHTRCGMVLLRLADGAEIGITDHDRDLSFDIGTGAVTYSASTGVLPSSLTLTEGFDADNIELTGPIGDTFTLEAIVGGRFDRADAYVFEVNWKSLGSGAIRLLRGKVGEARVEGGRFVLSIRSLVDAFNQAIGRVITPYCDADFGDARCGFDPLEVDAIVSSVGDGMRFTVSFTGDYADDFFNDGTVRFTSGDLADTAAVEVFDWSSAGAVVMFEPLASAPQVGDELVLRQGCPKTRAACRDFGNILNFRGFPEVPGSDQVLKYPVPGSDGS